MTLAPIGLGLMCKPPRPGISKTRLAASIGPEAAARLSRAFLEDSARAAREAADRAGIEPRAFFRPVDAAQEIAAILGPEWRLAYADAGDLGATMLEVLETCLRHCPAGAMIMGADVPLLSSDVLVEAAHCLQNGNPDEVVIVPSVDGGYCLLGVRSLEAATTLCAPMAWSTPKVLDETLRRASIANLTVRLLSAQRDMDELADLDWLRGQLAVGDSLAPRTRAVIAQLGEAPFR